MADRKQILLRLDPAVHDALARWAGDELRSTTAQIEYLLRQALSQAGRLPSTVGGMPRRGRPPKAEEGTSEPADSTDSTPPTASEPTATQPTATQPTATEPTAAHQPEEGP